MKVGVLHNAADYQGCLQTKNNQNVFLLLCRQAHPPLHNQLPLQEQRVTTMTQSCEGTKTMPRTKKEPFQILFLQLVFATTPIPRSATPVKDSNLLMKCSCWNKHCSVTTAFIWHTATVLYWLSALWSGQLITHFGKGLNNYKSRIKHTAAAGGNILHIHQHLSLLRISYS